MDVTLLNSKGKVIWRKKVEAIGYGYVVRDYTINLEGGTQLIISADAIKVIVDEEVKEW